MNLKIQEILEREWASTQNQLSPPPSLHGSAPSFEGFISWSSCLTPPLPSVWPCPPDGELIYYAYAAGLQPGVLCDARRTTVPWARFTVALPDGGVKFERLAEKPQLTDNQGFWPLRPDDVLLGKEAGVLFEEFPAALRRQDGSPDQEWMGLVKRSYGFWKKCNGVAARQIRPMHESFFAWLEK